MLSHKFKPPQDSAVATLPQTKERVMNQSTQEWMGIF